MNDILYSRNLHDKLGFNAYSANNYRMKYAQGDQPLAEFANNSRLDVVGQRFMSMLKSNNDDPPSVDGTNVENAEYYPINGEPFLNGNDGTDVHPNDVSQGQLGDCYLLASLAAVAGKNPDLIKDMIQENPDGTYTVTFNKKNSPFAIRKPAQEEVQITVKPEFPATKDDDNLDWAFADPGDIEGENSEFWVMLIEKAYAKWQGGYHNIEGGYPSDAMFQITGAKGESFRAGSMTAERLNDLYNNNAVAVSTHSDLKLNLFGTEFDIPDITDKVDLYRKNGGDLFTNHSYYVTGVDVENKAVSIRNPHGWSRGEITLTMDEFNKAFNRVDVSPVS